MGFQTKETDLPAVWVDVDQFDADVIAPGGRLPSNIFHQGDTVNLRVTWRQNGLLYPGMVGPGWHWHVRAYLELYGPNEAPGVIADFPAVTPVAVFQNTVDLPLSTVGNQLPAGVYKIIVTLSLIMPGHGNTIFHGFEEAGVIEVVNPIIP